MSAIFVCNGCGTMAAGVNRELPDPWLVRKLGGIEYHACSKLCCVDLESAYYAGLLKEPVDSVQPISGLIVPAFRDAIVISSHDKNRGIR